MKKLFSIIIICILSLPIFAENIFETEETYDANEAPVSTVNNTYSDDYVKAPDLPKKQITLPAQPTHFKQPYSKKKLAKKFIIAMLCVAGTSIFIYASLSVYNKITNFVNVAENNNSESSDENNINALNNNSNTLKISNNQARQTLDAPRNISEAVKSFIERTQWEN